MNHTPTPWTTRPGRDGACIVVPIANINQTIAVCASGTVRPDGHGPDNAAFIVRACNAHNALVAACEAALVAERKEG